MNYTTNFVSKWEKLTKNGINKPLAKLNLARDLHLTFAIKVWYKVHANL